MSSKRYSKVYKHTVNGSTRLFRFNHMTGTLECVEFPDQETLRDLRDKARHAHDDIEKDMAHRTLRSYQETGYIPLYTLNGLTDEDWNKKRDFWTQELSRRIG